MKESLLPIIAPSILSSNFATLGADCTRILVAGADWLHIDIMDGHFVPNISFGFPVIKSLRSHFTSSPLKSGLKPYFDCHCMVSNPEKWIKQLAESGADQVTFHYESEIKDMRELIKEIKSYEMKVGLALKPKTEIDKEIEKLIDESLLDMVLVMTVEPGFGGQKFMTDMMPKVAYLRGKYPDLNIQVDGGINIENVELVAKEGANIIVSGSGIYGVPDKAEISSLSKAVFQISIMKKINVPEETKELPKKTINPKSTIHNRVTKEFFINTDTLEVTQALIGKKVVNIVDGKKIGGIINEAEAYLGSVDSACHGYKGKTPKNAMMFKEGGHCYMFVCYGNNMLNYSIGKNDEPTAVLIRSLVMVDEVEKAKQLRAAKISMKTLSNGPGKLCSCLGLTKAYNGRYIITDPNFYIEDCLKIAPKDIQKTPRINIDYALKEDVEALYRFYADPKIIDAYYQEEIGGVIDFGAKIIKGAKSKKELPKKDAQKK